MDEALPGVAGPAPEAAVGDRVRGDEAQHRGSSAVFRLASQLGSMRFLVTNVLPYTPEMQDEILYSGP